MSPILWFNPIQSNSSKNTGKKTLKTLKETVEEATIYGLQMCEW